MQTSSQTLNLSRLQLHVVSAGEGVPVVMLHGWPQTHHEWRGFIPLLGKRYRLVMPDLPGLGDSTPVRSGAYDKRSVGQDLAEMCEAMGLRDFHLVGHDWGGPSAFGLAAARPQFLRSLSLIDVTVPGIGPDFSQGGRRWHHAFHMTPDLPEVLVKGREREYMSWFYREFSWRKEAITDADIDEYVRCYSKPGGLTAGFGYYRAIPQDREDNAALLASGFRLNMPVLALGGARPEARGRGLEPLESLRIIADRIEGGEVPDSGHFVPEEQTEWLADRLLTFFSSVDAGHGKR
jgi:pimeloyl-ACP methyl ester carboxylesterase